MDGDSDERQWKKGKEYRGKGEREENEKGDTFITRRRATEKIERQVVFARGSLPGFSRRMRRTREMYRKDSVARGWNPECKRKDTRRTIEGTRAILPQDHFLCKVKYCKYEAATKNVEKKKRKTDSKK